MVCSFKVNTCLWRTCMERSISAKSQNEIYPYQYQLTGNHHHHHSLGTTFEGHDLTLSPLVSQICHILIKSYVSYSVHGFQSTLIITIDCESALREHHVFTATSDDHEPLPFHIEFDMWEHAFFWHVKHSCKYQSNHSKSSCYRFFLLDTWKHQFWVFKVWLYITLVYVIPFNMGCMSLPTSPTAALLADPLIALILVALSSILLQPFFALDPISFFRASMLRIHQSPSIQKKR